MAMLEKVHNDINIINDLTPKAAAGVNPAPLTLPPDSVVAGCGTPWGGNNGKGAGATVAIRATGAITGAYSSTKVANSSIPLVSNTKSKINQ